MRRSVAAVALLLVAVATGVSAHTCYVDYDSQRDRTLVTSSGVWAGVDFDVAVTLDLCTESAQPLILRYVTLDGATVNGTLPADGAVSVSSPSGSLRWNASLTRAHGSKDLVYAATLEWREGVARGAVAPVFVDLCPNVIAGIARACEPDPAETFMITTMLVLSLATGAVVLAVAGVRKSSMRTTNRRIERTTRQASEGGDVVPHVPQREALHPAGLVDQLPHSIARQPGSYPGNVDAASGLQRYMHITRDPQTGDRYDVLLSHGGIKDRTLRFCVLQLLVLNDDIAAFPAGSVFVWVRKGRVGTAGKAAVIRHTDEALGIFEFIGLLRQMLAEGWTVRRGVTDFRGVASDLQSRRLARASAQAAKAEVAVEMTAVCTAVDAPAPQEAEPARADSGAMLEHQVTNETAIFTTATLEQETEEVPESPVIPATAAAADETAATDAQKDVVQEVEPAEPAQPATPEGQAESSAADEETINASASSAADEEEKEEEEEEEAAEAPEEAPEQRAALRPFLGMSLLEHAHSAEEKQLTVDTLWRGGPADIAGMRLGDVVTHVDSRPVSSLVDVRAVVLEAGIVGGTITVTVVSQETGEASELSLDVMTSDASARDEPYFFDIGKSEKELSPRRVQATP